MLDELDWVPLDSSNLIMAAWEGGRLYLEFQNGRVYSYEGVPEALYEELLAAESAGKFFAKRIKDVYECWKER